MRTLFIVIILLWTSSRVLAGVTLSGPLVICEGSAATLSAPTNMVNYLWSTGETTRSISVYGAGRYTCRVTTQVGNIDTGSIDLRVGFRPRPHIGNTVEYLCEGDEASLEAPTYFQSYHWSTGATTSSIRVTESGIYWITVTDTNGCSGQSDKVQVIIVPKPNVHINGQDAVCPGHVTSYSVTPTPGANYQWFCDGGTVASGQGTNAIQINWTRSGTIRLRASYQRPDGGNCTADTLVVITVSTRLRPQIQYERNSICRGESILLEAAEGYSSYRWSTGATTPYIIVNTPGPFWVQVTDASGCTGVTDTLTVLGYEPPVASIKGPPAICEGAMATLVASSRDNNVVLWEWSTGQRGQAISVGTGGQYAVVGWTLDGCKDTAYTDLIVSPPIDVEIPDVNTNVVPTGISVGALITVRNHGASDISIMSVRSSLPTTLTPSTPRLVSVGKEQVFTVGYTPLREGPFYIELQWIVMSADCEDTLSSVIQGVASGDPPLGSLTITIPDTTVDVGKEIKLPVTIAWNVPLVSLQHVQWSVTLPSDAFLLQRVDGGELVTHDRVMGDQVLRLSLGQLALGTGDTVVYLVGLPMLRTPFTSPVVPSQLTTETGVLLVTNYNDGSITTTGCWLPGRLITTGALNAQVTIHTLAGAQVYNAQVQNVTPSTIDEIMAQLNLSAQPVFVRILAGGGQVIWSGIYFTNSISR